MTNKQALLLSITERRKALGLTQEEVAKQIGVSRTTIYHLETGKTNFTFETLLQILQILKLKFELSPE